MSQSEKPKFEKDWQRTFESAAEPPSPSVWDAIEKRLDAAEATVVPLLWWKNPKVWYAAAAVAALLLLSWPMLQVADESKGERVTQLVPQAPAPSGSSAAAHESDLAAPVAEPLSGRASEAIISTSDRLADATITRKESFPSPLTDSPQPITPEALGQPFAVVPQGIATAPETSDPLFVDSLLLAEVTKDEIDSLLLVEVTKDEKVEDANEVERVESLLTLTKPIAALWPVHDLAKLDIHLPKPAIRVDLAVSEAVAATRPKRPRVREFWAGLSLMPAAFNPKMNVTSAPQAFADANAGRQALSSTSQAQLSYAVQAQAGKQLSKHWSVETGVSYLQGNSTFASDGYLLDAVTSQSTNVLQDALYSNTASKDNKVSGSLGIFNTSARNSSASYIDFEQHTSNDYRYLQLPVQAGFTLNPDGKLNYTLLGGVVANLFLQNEIKTQAGYVFANNADDGLYRALNWSAATGVRVNYRLSDHWNATLTGSYQKAVASILKGDGALESRPQLYGLSWGVRYVF